MKASPKMQALMAQLAKQHGVDFSQVGAHLRLALPGYDRLVIEAIGGQRVSVAHYFELNGDLVADPDVVFFTGDGRWLPIEITQALGGYRLYAELANDGQQLECLDPRGQADLAAFAEFWAQNLRDQGWLAHGQRWTR
jgi:hypothetical protein